MHVYRIESGETDWVVALNLEDAKKVWCEHYDFTPIDKEEIGEVLELEDKEQLKIYLDEPYQDPSPYLDQPCYRWAQEGKGLIASTCY